MKFSGLSQSTIHHLESGSLKDIEATKLFSLLSLIGLNVIIKEFENRYDALDIVRKLATVSYKSNLTRTDLSDSLAEGVLPEKIYPHVAFILDEAPLELIVSAVEEVAILNQVEPKEIWKNIYILVAEMHSSRPAWK